MDKLLDYSNGKVLLYLYGGYHSNCNITLAMLDKINQARPDVRIVKINTLKHYHIKEKYNIKALPALIYLENGIFINKMSGSLNYKSVLMMLDGSD